METEDKETKTKKKVLIVDDEKGFSDAVKINLELTGKYEVACENESAKALEHARTFQPDIVLLDIVMPGMDGGDVANQFKDDAELNSIPVVWITALLTQEESHGKIMKNEDGQQMLAKPATLDQIVECIDRLTKW